MSENTSFDEGSAIAIVGMAGRFPKSPNIDAYWANLRDGLECLSRFSLEELEASGEDPLKANLPNYIPVSGALDGLDEFDAGFFGFSPRDASIMDPQHRNILECAWEAFENAGIDPERFEGSIGVFAGSGHNAYLPYNLLTNPSLLDTVGFFLLRHTGNDKDFLATRISYCLKLTGPSINVQTACSTSLVATHVACQSLLNGECDLALAGGVTIELPHRRGYLYEEGGISSPDGHCRAFDAQSKGTLFGSGAGVVALRRYSDALEAGDIIHAVIRGSAVNNDGANKVGYLAPSVEGQASCMAEALTLADIDPRSVSYIECHGTGTPVGDPIEISALTQAFSEETEDTGFCAIGSVKTNIGHLDTAAGVASLVKVVQSLKHRQIPASLHYREPNPQIDFDKSPFFVNAALRDWEMDADMPRRAAINSLGVGGTNAFMIVEETPAGTERPSGPSRPEQLVLLSARSAEAVQGGTERLASFLTDQPDLSMADVAYTLSTCRRAFGHRRMVLARDAADAVAAFADPTRVLTQPAGKDRTVCFLFPGGGAQYPNMGRDLYQHEEVYRAEVDRGLSALAKKVDFDLKKLLFPAPGDEEAAGEELQLGSRSLPSLFITEYALAKLYMSWGVEPTALLGHSMGEYVAACLAGVFSMEEGLGLVLLRGQLFEKLDKGAMLSVPLPADELAALMGDGLDIAVVNGPSASVASGPVAAIDALFEQLTGREIDVRRIRIHVAAHSRMLDPILDEFHAYTKTIALKTPTLPLMSNVSGTWMTEEQATDPGYWVKHLRQTVRFSDNLGEVLADENRVMLEVAPGRTLTSLAKAHPAAGIGRPVFNSLRHPKEEVEDTSFLLGVLGRLWLCGASVDFDAFFEGQQRRRLELPTYAWDHQRYWIEPGKSQAAAPTRSLRKKLDVADWFYQPSWHRQLLPSEAPASADEADKGAWLVFVDATGFGERLVAGLRASGERVVTVTEGEAMAPDGEHGYRIVAGEAGDYDALWTALESRKLEPCRVLHLWSLCASASDVGDLDAVQARGFYSLLFLAQAMGKAGLSQRVTVGVVTNSLQPVAAGAVFAPERATIYGPCKVMMQEIAEVTARSIDIELPDAGSWRERLLLERLPQEMTRPSQDHVVAYRGHERFVQRFEPCKLESPTPDNSRLREGGVYLVTGGLGGLGLTLASHLATTRRAKLVLVGRTALPPRDGWAAYVDDAASDPRIRKRIVEIQRIEAIDGAEVMVVAADVTDPAAMKGVVGKALERFGTIHGVYHTAGVLDDGIIQLKAPEAAAAVLAPKLHGTLALDAALSGRELDFMVLYSSVSSLTGLTGQVDYAAANAFLDAFAHARTERDGRLCVAVNWNAWQRVGMAAELARELGVGGSAAAERDAKHPLLDRCVKDTAAQKIYATDLRADSHWLLDEHRIKGGEALIPGTGYLELTRAALAETVADDRAIEIRELQFQAPFVVRAGETRELRVVLDRSDDGWDVQIQGPGGSLHAMGSVRDVTPPTLADADLAAIAARCTARRDSYDSADDPNLDFGPRWNNRQHVDYGPSGGDGAAEALVSLALPDEFADDGPAFALHPALMDFATAGAQALIEGYGVDTHFYVPMSYGKLTVVGPLPAEVKSHVRLKESSEELAVYDVTVYDSAGKALVDVSEFVMRRVTDRAIMSAGASTGSIEGRPDHSSGHKGPKPGTANPILELGLEQGIAPDEGMGALDRVLAAPLTAQIIVSSQDLDALIESTRAAEPWEGGDEEEDTLGTKVMRPPLANAFVAPETELHKTIVKVWQELLGIEGIGIHDDFFDLGGHSLLLTQLVSRVRKQVKTEISLRKLFEKRTVAGIGEEVEAARGGGGDKGPKLRRVARDAYRKKR
jgi:acyl transferase domain-containing protein/acyl carrier protein